MNPNPPAPHGIIPPIITPLITRDELDVSGLERILEHMVDGGVHGIFVLGTTGETSSLSHPLRHRMVTETARILDGRVPLYVGITETSMTECLELAETARELEAAAAVAAPPFYFPVDQPEVKYWYETLLDNLPLPLLLYNMPSCTKVSIAEETLVSLIHHESVIGFKDSSGDLGYMEMATRVAREHRPGWPVLVGPEHLLVESMKLGAAGGVTGGANIAPRLLVSLYEALANGDTEKVAIHEETLNQLGGLYKFGSHPSSYLKGLKCAFDMLGTCSGYMAEPLEPFREKERNEVARWLGSFEATGLLPERIISQESAS